MLFALVVGHEHDSASDPEHCKGSFGKCEANADGSAPDVCYLNFPNGSGIWVIWLWLARLHLHKASLSCVSGIYVILAVRCLTNDGPMSMIIQDQCLAMANTNTYMYSSSARIIGMAPRDKPNPELHAPGPPHISACRKARQPPLVPEQFVCAGSEFRNCPGPFGPGRPRRHLASPRQANSGDRLVYWEVAGYSAFDFREPHNSIRKG